MLYGPWPTLACPRIFNIIREEGGADGGVVVQDCLELLNNLLRANQVSKAGQCNPSVGQLHVLSRLPGLAVHVPVESLAAAQQPAACLILCLASAAPRSRRKACPLP